MPKRQSLKGRGADIFFDDPPPSAPTAEIRPVAEKVKYIKRTYEIDPEVELTLEQLRLDRLRRGIKTDKSKLVNEAIRLLAQKESA